MVKIYPVVTGNTLDFHEKIIKKLTKRGVKVAKTADDSDATVVFCPIVSRFETDVDSALSSIPVSGSRNVILVAMHHTYDPNYALPTNRQMEARGVLLCVDCLFYENTGLLSCAHNKKSVKKVYKELRNISKSAGINCAKSKGKQ